MKIMRCKNEMFQKGANGVPLSTMSLFQYTGWGALKGIASSSLWLTPVAYLNDPNEGKLGFDIAKGMFKKIGAIFQNWDVKGIRQSFVGSFTKKVYQCGFITVRVEMAAELNSNVLS